MGEKQIYAIPQTYDERERIRNLIERFTGDLSIKPPTPMEDLTALSEHFIRKNKLETSLQGWLMVEMSNCLWRDTVATVPYHRRVLLLPKCLSHSLKCRAETDDLGLLCRRCNHCTIPALQDQADSLGLTSLVAEGFTSVISLIEHNLADTVIGVACLDSLEKAFPLLVDEAVPGLAIPLNVSGCKDTNVDVDYVARLMKMQPPSGGKMVSLLNFGNLKDDIKCWFTTGNVRKTLSPADNPASAIAQEWLCRDGKRWRPYLLAAVWSALTGKREIPANIQLAAIAIECFHKASLVHDDIQDDDTLRNGQPTINAAHGTPAAINVGDALLGEGYRLLTECGDIRLLKIATDAHIALCKGQGMELAWSANPHPLTIDFVLDIFRYKTVPAFDVAIVTGAVCAGADTELITLLRRYSCALGVAYQLQDDMDDFAGDEAPVCRPSAVQAIIDSNATSATDALDYTGRLMERYRSEAINVLREINNGELKRLLFRVAGKILK